MKRYGSNRGPGLITSNVEAEFKRRGKSEPDLYKLNTGRVATGAMQKAGADISRTAPLFYDPRYSHTTLAIPTDERTLNGLYRYYADTDPLVGTAIHLHTTFPLSRIELTDCGDKAIQQHFEEMWHDRINAPKLLTDIGNEFWTLGNVFPFGAWNEDECMWERFAVLNPDYVQVESTWVADKPLIKLQPEDALKRIVNTGSPRMLYDQLSPEIIRYVRLNQPIPLHPNNIFHLAHNRSPYEKLGKSLIKRILKTLMYEDRLQNAQFAIASRHIAPLTVVKLGDTQSGWLPEQAEIDEWKELLSAHELDPNFCYDAETECLTDSGWKKYTELSYADKVAAFDPETNGVRYEHPSVITVQDYKGDMIRFKSRTMDMLVTPNHRMWVERKGKWQIVPAEDVGLRDRMRAVVDVVEALKPLPATLTVANKEVSTKAFFELVGWYLAEGSLAPNNYGVCLTQSKPAGVKKLRKLFKQLPWKATGPFQKVQYQFNGKALGDYMHEQFGKLSDGKRIPRWMLDAQPEYLELLLKAWASGDATCWKKKDGDTFYEGATTSPELVQGLQEAAFKSGYATYTYKLKPQKGYMLPSRGACTHRVDGTPFLQLYRIHFSKGRMMSYPRFDDHSKVVETLEPVVLDVPRVGKRVDWAKVDLRALIKQTGGCFAPIARALNVTIGTISTRLSAIGIRAAARQTVRSGCRFSSPAITRVPYDGKIWCVKVSTGLFVTRRVNRCIVSGNTVIYHAGVDIQYYGANGKILPTNYEFDRVNKLKFIGLGISEALLTGQGTYANAFASLSVARQRYLHFQLMLSQFVNQGILKTVASVAGFYRSNKTVVGAYHAGKKFGEVTARPGPIMEGVRDEIDYAEAAKELVARASEQSKWEKHQELIVPKLSLDLMSLSDDVQYRSFLMAFDKHFQPKDGERRRVSDSTFYRLAHLDNEAEKRQVQMEDDENYQVRLRKAVKDKHFNEFLTAHGLEGGAKPKAGKGAAGGEGLEMDVPPDLGGAPEEGGGVPDAPQGAGEFAGEPGAPELAGLEAELTEGLASEEASLASMNRELLKKISAQ